MNQVAEVNRIKALSNTIRFILIKNDPNGSAFADTEKNDDKVIAPTTERSIKPEMIAQEMQNLLVKIQEAYRLIEEIDDFPTRDKLRELIDDLEIARRNIADDAKQKITIANNQPQQSIKQSLVGGTIDLSDFA